MSRKIKKLKMQRKISKVLLCLFYQTLNVIINSFLEKPTEEASLGDFIGAMGSLMTAFAPKEEAQSMTVMYLSSSSKNGGGNINL